MASRAFVSKNIDDLVKLVTAQAKGGDHILCMSNARFGDIHRQLLNALQSI
jgi:UDP-N-acetylmuramate: L-alanyl-gamma-D-glutamyl-meso-diaminopimelate ligase